MVHMASEDRSRLERSCDTRPRDWIRIGRSRPGLDRIEAHFAGHGFDPHRHDSYAIGITLHGVQSFGYRGTTLHSRAGQAMVLHPDEVHDGRAGTEAGFRYRILYIDPALIQEALGGRALPFVREAVTGHPRLTRVVSRTLDDLDARLSDLECDEMVAGLADALAALDQSMRPGGVSAFCRPAVRNAKAFLDAHIGRNVYSEELEAISGLSRFSLARHFRAYYGTSPYRYVVMRRLDLARQLMLTGPGLAETAVSSGFADQSHMARQFKRAYGITPGRWLHAVAQCGDDERRALAKPRPGKYIGK
jgi:AraC-like DNA-binding protein